MTVRLCAPPRSAGLPRADLKLLRSRARCIMRELGHGPSELSIALVDDLEMAELNGAWRGRSKATDVLSFSLIEGEQSGHRGELLGDVVIGILVIVECIGLPQAHCALASPPERLTPKKIV